MLETSTELSRDERDLEQHQLAPRLFVVGGGAMAQSPPASVPPQQGAGDKPAPAFFNEAQNDITETFRACLEQELIDVMPPYAATALAALEKNCNAHGEFMGGQTRLAKSVPSPTLRGRGRPSKTGHASRRTIHDGLAWLERHGVISSWIPRAGLYGVKAYKFASSIVRRNLVRLKRLARRTAEFAQGRSSSWREEDPFLSLPPEAFGICSRCNRMGGEHHDDCPNKPPDPWWRTVCKFVCAPARWLSRCAQKLPSGRGAVTPGVPDEW